MRSYESTHSTYEPVEEVVNTCEYKILIYIDSYAYEYMCVLINVHKLMRVVTPAYYGMRVVTPAYYGMRVVG